ncbi:MAG: DUF134 domain-containing protein [Acidobacteriota bacterium]
MPRPKLCRWIRFHPGSSFFKPQGIPLRFLHEVSLSMDEFEAIRLADFEGLYQEEAAKKMKISRQTFGRILTEAHRKIAECLVQGKALSIEGGDYIMITRRFRCTDCGHTWEVAHGMPRPTECSHCSSINILRAEEDRGFTGRGGFAGGRGGLGGRGAQGAGRAPEGRGGSGGRRGLGGGGRPGRRGGGQRGGFRRRSGGSR